MATRVATRRAKNGTVEVDRSDLEALLEGLRAARAGELEIRLPARRAGIVGELNDAFNRLAERRETLAKELDRVSRKIGREGRMTERLEMPGAKGSWGASVDAVNSMIDDLVRPTTEVARVLGAVAEGDL